MKNIYDKEGKLTETGVILLTFTLIAALKKGFQIFEEITNDSENQRIELSHENKKST